MRKALNISQKSLNNISNALKDHTSCDAMELLQKETQAALNKRLKVLNEVK